MTATPRSIAATVSAVTMKSREAESPTRYSRNASIVRELGSHLARADAISPLTIAAYSGRASRIWSSSSRIALRLRERLSHRAR